jgi:hypothetical protein
VPELVSAGGELQGTIVLSNATQRLFLGASDPTTRASQPSQCQLQDVRRFSGSSAILPFYAGTIPPGYSGYVPPPSYPGYAPLPPSPYLDPVPGPTLRAKIGDIVQLTFLNQIGTGPYWDSIDRGEKGQGCDRAIPVSV